MKTSLSPIALMALLVGPGLAAWARQDAPTPTAPTAPTPDRVDVSRLAGVRLPSDTFPEKPDAQDPTDEERALQDKIRALEERAAELEAVLRDRLDATEFDARVAPRARLAEVPELKAKNQAQVERTALEARMKEYLLRADLEGRASREVAVRDLLAAVPDQIAEIQDEKMKAKVLEALKEAKVKLGPQARLKAEEYLVRAKEMRDLAESRRAELEQGQYKEAHPRYQFLQERVDDFQEQAEETARAYMRVRREDGTRRRMEQEIAQATRDEQAARRDAENARAHERELAQREGQRRQEEDRLRTELDSERARLAEMRAKLEQARAEMRRNVPRNVPRAEPTRPTDRWDQRSAPRAEPQRPTSSDVTIIVEQGDVHVHTGGGSPQVITAPTTRLPQGNLRYGTFAPLPAPSPPPAPPAQPESHGTTQIPARPDFWRSNLPVEYFARANVEFEFPEDFKFAAPPLLDLPLPEFDFSAVIQNATIPKEALDVYFNTPFPIEDAPECETKPAPETALEGEVSATYVREYLDLATPPTERAPSQAELLDRILRLSEELKAEVGALRSELRELRDVVRGAPRR